MIRKIEFENVFSFLEPTTFNLLVNNNAPESSRYRQSVYEGERVAKVAGIIGPNASGKSNILRVIGFIKRFMLESFAQKPDAEISLRPFMLKTGPFAPAKIEIEFECAERVYRYRVVLTTSVILSEELDVLDLSQKASIERRRFKQLFSRTLRDGSGEYEIKANTEFGLSEGTKELVRRRKNASLISASLFSGHEQCMFLKDYWSKVVTKIKQLGDRPYSLDQSAFESTEFYYKNQHFRSSMERIMSKCDFGLVGLDIERIEIPQASSTDKQEFFMPYGKHLGIDGNIYRLPFPWESAGTLQIYILLSTLLPVLESGGVAAVDELEADLHPDLLPALLSLFTSNDTNPRRAQLIFSSHATPLLNVLDKYQTFIVSKNDQGVSKAVRLDSVNGVRSDDNYFAKYTAGFYGGTPKIEAFRELGQFEPI